MTTLTPKTGKFPQYNDVFSENFKEMLFKSIKKEKREENASRKLKKRTIGRECTINLIPEGYATRIEATELGILLEQPI